MDEVNWKDSYEAARIELKRAETLLKERHVNTKKVLVKQKKLAEELAKEKEKRKGAEKKSAAAARENAKLEGVVQGLQARVELLEKTVAQLQTSTSALLRKDNETKSSIKRVQIPSIREEEPRARPAKKPKTAEEKNTRAQQTARRTNERATHTDEKDDNDDISGNQQSVLEHEWSEQHRAAADTQMSEILTHLMRDKHITKAKIKTAVHITASRKDIWDEKRIATATLYIMFECCRPTYVEQRAPIHWAPLNWFIMKNTSEIMNLLDFYEREDVSSLVCMWCDAAALEQNKLAWLLYYVHMLDARAPDVKLMQSLGNTSQEIVMQCFERGYSNGIFSITEVCCATTVALAAFRGQGALEAATKFLVNIAGRTTEVKYSTIEQLQVMCLAIALEVWPHAVQSADIPSQVLAHIWSITENYVASTVPKHPSRPIYYSICHYAAHFIRKTMVFLLPEETMAKAME